MLNTESKTVRHPWARRARVFLILALSCTLVLGAMAPASAAGELIKVGVSGQRYVWTPGGC